MNQVLTNQALSGGDDVLPKPGAPDLPACMGFFRRAVSYALDYGTVHLLVKVLAGTIVASDNFGLRFAGYTWLSSALAFWDPVITITLGITYFALFEWLFGATPGKVILRMRVIREDGMNCTFAGALARSAIRPIDGLLFGLVAAANMRRPLNQRWGDKVAHTLVVSGRDTRIQVHQPWWRFLLAAIAVTALAATVCMVYAGL